MAASIMNEDKLCDREDYVEDQEIKLENKEEQNQLKETLEAKENETVPLKRTKTVSYLTGRTDGQRATIGRAQELREQEVAVIAETALS